MNTHFKNKVVIITGASSGIGLACAHAFAAAGAHVVMSGRNENNLMEAANALQQKHNTKVLWAAGDVSIESDCKSLIEKTILEFGTIHVLINNAGISMRALFENCDLNVIRQLINTNFWGTVYCTHYALKEILINKGSIVGVSSIAGFKGLPGRTGYSASKFAMHGFLESLRIENLKKGLHVLIACPGYTASNIRNTALNAEGKSQRETPLDESNLMSAEKVAEEILNAISKRQSTLILTTQGKLTVFLNRFFPRWLDKKVYSVVSKEKDSPFK